jgi:hypothetical protein
VDLSDGQRATGPGHAFSKPVRRGGETAELDRVVGFDSGTDDDALRLDAEGWRPYAGDAGLPDGVVALRGVGFRLEQARHTD